MAENIKTIQLEKIKLEWTLEKVLDWGIKLIAAIAGLLTSKGIASIIEAKLAKAKQSEKDAKVKSHYDTLVAMRDCKEFMLKIGNFKTVHRVLLLKGSNSGGIPVVGAPYYARAIEGAGEYTYTMENFSQVRVDYQYIQMLLNLISNKKIEIDVEKLPECLIRKIYETENVKKSVWFYIGANDLEIFFMSVSTKTEFDLNEIAEIEIIANKISTIFDKI